jgi:hypothetical protein
VPPLEQNVSAPCRITRIARQQGLLPDTSRLWLRGYHDQIIRNARHLANARAYIRDNPIRADR